MAILEQKPLTPFFLRLTHTGVHKNGAPNRSSVPLYDLQVGLEYQTRKQTIYVPVGGYVDVPIAPRVLLAMSAGSIGLLLRDGLLSLDIVARFRDIVDHGGSAGTGITLAVTVPNVARTDNVLSFVIESGPDIEGYIAAESLDVTGLTGTFGTLNGSYTIDTVTLGTGLVGADPGLYLVTVESTGPDIAGASLASVNLTLPDGKVNIELHSSGGLAGLGGNNHSYVAGDAIVTGCMKASAFTLIRTDNGSGVCPNSLFWEETSGEPYWKDSAGVLHPLLGGGGGVGGGRVYQFSQIRKVPNAGTLYLYYGQVLTSAASFSVDTSASLRAATIVVNVSSTNTYQLEVLKNGIVVETLILLSGSTEALTSGFTTSLAASDNLAVRLVKTAGSGTSSFNNITVALVMDE